MRAQLVVIGGSLGGADAVSLVLASLPAAFPAAIAVVLHRGIDSDELLAHLAQRTRLPVSEPDDKEAIERGRVYVAPADYHLLVDGGSFALSLEGRVIHARPCGENRMVSFCPSASTPNIERLS